MEVMVGLPKSKGKKLYEYPWLLPFQMPTQTKSEIKLVQYSLIAATQSDLCHDMVFMWLFQGIKGHSTRKWTTHGPKWNQFRIVSQLQIEIFQIKKVYSQPC